MKKTIVCWSLLAAMCLLAGCRSSKQAVDGGGAGTEWADSFTAAALKQGTVSAKLNLQLSDGNKGVSVGGSCNLKRDEVIQLSLVAMGIMEVGRIELTPQYIMMVDRMGRQYVRVGYDELVWLREAGIDFYTFQALFWNDLFVPGNGGRWSADEFMVSRRDNEAFVSTDSGRLVEAAFVVDLATGLIRNTLLRANSRPDLPALEWSYTHFAEVGQKSFPDNMQLSVAHDGKALRAVFSLSNLKAGDKDIRLTDEPGGRYKKVEVKDILNTLIK